MPLPILSKRSPSTDTTKRSGAEGFSLLEVVVAMLVLTIGLLGVASAIGYALAASNRGRGVTNSKMLIVSVLEQMETLRDTGQLNFDEISNTAQPLPSTFRGFPATFQPVSTAPGPDGVFGTCDDLSSAIGGDNTWCTSDDILDLTRQRPGVMRKIVIIDKNAFLKRIEVTLQYSPNGGETRTLVGVGYLNDNAHSNYIP